MTPGKRFPLLRAFALAAGLLLLDPSAGLHALTINLTFDSSVTSLPNAAAYEAATTYAAQQLENLFSDNITLNITVIASSDPDEFGESGFNLFGSSYNEIRSALMAHASNTNNANALASLADLPTMDPTNGGAFFVPNAEAKVLGLAGTESEDGTFTFGSSYNFALTSPYIPTSTQFDFIGVAMHEMTEIMGRCSGLSPSFYVPYDLFRFQGNNARDLTAGSSDYFSIDNGATNLKTFNSESSNGGDPQDWASGTNDACNAFAVEGKVNAFSAVDVEAMDVIGYTVTGVMPAFSDGPATAVATVGIPYSFRYTASPSGTFALATGPLPTGLTLTAAGLLSGTPTQSGTFTGTVSVTNGTNSATQSFSIVVIAAAQPLAFISWVTQYPTLTQTGPNDVPQGDGVPNLLKYLCNIDPSRPMTAQDRSALPTVTFNASGTTATLKFRRYAQQTNLTITAQDSTDLQNWSTTGSPTQMGTDSTTHDPLMQLLVTVSGTQHAYRLRITSP